jgi:hypothetical protein
MPRLVETELATTGQPDPRHQPPALVGDLGRRELEDQPAAAGVDVGVTQHVAQESPVGAGVVAVDDHVAAGDHRLTIRAHRRDDSVAAGRSTLL